MPETQKQRVTKGAVWATLEKFSVQAMHFDVGMVLHSFGTNFSHNAPLLTRAPALC